MISIPPISMPSDSSPQSQSKVTPYQFFVGEGGEYLDDMGYSGLYAAIVQNLASLAGTQVPDSLANQTDPIDRQNVAKVFEGDNDFDSQLRTVLTTSLKGSLNPPEPRVALIICKLIWHVFRLGSNGGAGDPDLLAVANKARSMQDQNQMVEYLQSVFSGT